MPISHIYPRFSMISFQVLFFFRSILREKFRKRRNSNFLYKLQKKNTRMVIDIVAIFITDSCTNWISLISSEKKRREAEKKIRREFFFLLFKRNQFVSLETVPVCFFFYSPHITNARWFTPLAIIAMLSRNTSIKRLDDDVWLHT